MPRESNSRALGGAIQGGGLIVPTMSLPNELLLEVWYQLAALERVCVSQVCRQWRALSLSTPRLWTRVAFVSTLPSRWSVYPKPADGRCTVYWPRNGTTNGKFLETLLLRSGSLLLDVTIILGSRSMHMSDVWGGLEAHSTRISRIHILAGPNVHFQELLRICAGELPALRTVTAGFDDDEIVYHDLPARSYPGTPFPALAQVHLGGGLPTHFVFFIELQVPSMQELTLTPFDFNLVLQALPACPNLARLNLVMSRFSVRASSAMRAFRQFADMAAAVRELCMTDMPAELDRFVLTSLNDARFRHLVLDYTGRESGAGLRSLRSPYAVLVGELRLTVRLRESVYEVEVDDGQERRRSVLFDESAVGTIPSLWGCYLSTKTVTTATVDALAWRYFAADLPRPCNIQDLAVVVHRDSAELDGIDLGLAQFANLRTLRIDVLRAGVRFTSSKARALVHSIAESLHTLSLPRNARFDEVEGLVRAAGSLQWY